LAKARERLMDAEVPEGHDGPLRLCAATRTPHPVSDLIRFVASPDGEIVPDIGLRLPGRGVWVSADRATVASAVRDKVFARSLKRPVKAAPDLPAHVIRLLEQRVSAALSLANKAGLVTVGFAQVEAAVESGGVAALLHGKDAAFGGRDKLDRKYKAVAAAKGAAAHVISSLTIEQMSLAMGRANVVHAALAQGGATVKFLSEVGRLERFQPDLTASCGHGAAETQVGTD
jgi:predicted RNA-binding protein YlxR (DUF448 family)